MLSNDFATDTDRQPDERREKLRFPIQRELRFKILKNGAAVDSGSGETIDIGSGGVSFCLDRNLDAGGYIQLSISWPVLLENSCRMRLVAFGRVLRSGDGRCACSIERHEFRTQARMLPITAAYTDSRLRRWADTMRRENLKSGLATA